MVIRNSFSGSLSLATVNVSNSHVGMSLAVAEELAHLHEENLVLIVGPLKDGLPEKQSVSWNMSVLKTDDVLKGYSLTFQIVFESGADEVTDLTKLGVPGPTTNGELCQSQSPVDFQSQDELTLYSMLLISVKPAS